jgi:hypothetical protein
MALLEVESFSREGTSASEITTAATAGGDRFTNTGKEVLEVSNTSGGPINVTVESTVTVDGQAVADLVVAVADSDPTTIGPFPLATYGSEVNVSYESVTSVAVRVLQLNPGS